MSIRKGTLTAFACTVGMAFSAVATTVATASWKSGGDRSNPGDASNWECKDSSGNIIDGAVPTDDTVITISGETDFNLPARTKIHAKSLVFDDNVKLTQDADWSGMIAGAEFGGSYTPLEYLFAPNGSYIDTEFAPNGNTKMTMEVEVQGAKKEYWWGVWDNSYSDMAYAVGIDGPHEIYVGYVKGGGGMWGVDGSPSPRDLAVGDRIIVTLDKNHVTVKTADNEIVFLDKNRWKEVLGDLQLENTIYLFKQNRKGTEVFSYGDQVGVKMYSCQIWDGEELVRNFVPAKDENGTICLFETEGNKFYYDKKAGSNFSGGAAGAPRVRATSDHAIALNPDAIIDLNGKKLTMDGAALNGSFGEITSNVAGGKLEVNVAEGTVATDSNISLTGKFGIEKIGAGTLEMKHGGQSFTDGVEIFAGLVRPKDGGWKGSEKLFGVESFAMTIHAGGMFDMRGGYDYPGSDFILDGGAMINTVSKSYKDCGGIGNVTLTADSYMRIDKHIGLSNDGKYLDLGGYTLDLEINDELWVGYRVIRNGTLNLIKGNLNVTTQQTTTKDSGSADFNLTLGGTLMLGRDMTVGDLVLGKDAAFEGDKRHDSTRNTGKLLVRGVFAPTSTNFPDIVMQSGSTLDISDFEGLFTVYGTMSDADRKLAFAENAKISVKVASGLVSGTKVIAWDAADMPNAEFSFVGDNTAAVVKEDGLYYGGDASSTVVTRAEWTGAKDDGDLTNPGNWTCYNENGNIVYGGTPDNDSKVVFDVPTLNVNIPAGAEIGYSSVSIDASTTLLADCDLRGANQLAFADDITVDTAGHKLYVNRLVGNFTVTDTTTGEPGELVVDVPAGATAETKTLALTGNLKLVKDGAGSMDMNRTGQTFSGGFEIKNGAVSPVPGWRGGDKYIGDEKNLVTIDAGGSYDINGGANFSSYSWVLNGGTLVNSRRLEWPDWTTFGKITLTADSFVNLAERAPFASSTCVVDLGGHVLTVDTDTSVKADTCFYAFQCQFKNGTLVANSGIIDFCAKNNTTADLGSSDLNLVIRCKYALEREISVASLELGETSELLSKGNCGLASTGRFKAYGTFAPTSQSFPDIVMQNGSTLDLRGQENAMSVASSYDGCALDFAENATISVNVTGRVLETGAKLISWYAKPAANFVFVGDETLAAATSEGLFYGADPTSQEIDKATWVGGGDPSKWNDAGNWDCRNTAGVNLGGRTPDKTAKVTYSWPTIGLEIAEGSEFKCSSFVIAESTQLVKDTDLTGVTRLSFADGVVIDTCGHQLTLSSLASAGNFMITNSLEKAGDDQPNVGVLKVVVPSETTLSTTAVALGGNLKVVKDGEGTLSMERPGQTFTAGLDIVRGIVKPREAAGYSGVGKYSFGVSQGTVTVYEGGMFDINGMVDFQDMHFVLSGGAIGNSVWMSWPDYSSLGTLTLTEDSFIDAEKRFSISNGGPADIDLGGHTLTVNTSTATENNWVWLNRCRVHNGTLVLSEGSMLSVSCKETSVKTLDRGSEDLTVIVGGVWMLGYDMTVSNLTFLAGGSLEGRDDQNGNPPGCGQFLVGGCYKPNATVAPVPRSGKVVAFLKDGATLDLGGVTGVLAGNTLAFADGATIYVGCGSRELSGPTELVSWSKKPDNYDTLRFKVVPELKQLGWKVLKNETGLQLKKEGFTVYVK